MVVGRGEFVGQAVGVDRHVEVHAEFFERAKLVDRRHGERDVLEAHDRAVLGPPHRLVQIRRLVHLREARERDFGGLKLERGAEVELQHRRTAGVETRDGLMGFFVLEREVAGVVGDTEVRIDEPLGGFFGAELLEETQGFRRVLGVTNRLGLQGKAEMRAGAIAQAGEMFGAREQIATHDLELVGGATEALERTRQRADGADLVRRTESSEEVEKAIGVFEARGFAPIRREDIILHGLSVKRTEGEAVDAGDDAVLLVEPGAESRERGGHGELLRGEVAEAQAEDVRLAGRDAVTHAQGMVAQAGERLDPPFAAVDVGAVGEGKSGRELHAIRPGRRGPGSAATARGTSPGCRRRGGRWRRRSGRGGASPARPWARRADRCDPSRTRC